MNHKQQLQHELALIDLEKRQLLIERKELELKQRLEEINQREQTEPVIVDLTEDQDDEVILKQELEADVGQPTLQDTVTTPLPDNNNTGAPLAANFARCENDSKSQLPKVEKQDGCSPQPEDVHDSKGSDSDASSNPQKDPDDEAATNESALVNPPSQKPPAAPILQESSRETEKQPSPSGSTSRSDSLKRPISATDDNSNSSDRGDIDDKPSENGPQTGKSGPQTQDTLMAESEPSEKSQALEDDDPNTDGNCSLSRRRTLAVYYRDLLASHLVSSPSRRPGRASKILSRLRERVTCDPGGAHAQIRELMPMAQRPDKFVEIMLHCSYFRRYWWHQCLRLPSLEKQKARVREVVANLAEDAVGSCMGR